jgi:putative chitinase
MRAVEIIRRVAPHARPDYVAAFDAGDAQLAAAQITTPPRLAHFLAQVLEETGGLTIATESGNYSAPRICAVWPSRFGSIAAAEPYAHNAEKLFNTVYANRMGNGPPASGDGFRYRGRGILQTTGRGSYRKYGQRYGVDFETNPDLVVAAEHALKPALAEWTDAGCNALADRDDIHAITKRINGGYTNFAERVRWLHVVKPLIDRVDLTTPPPALEPLPAANPPAKPSAKVASRQIKPRQIGASGSLIAAFAAAWHALDRAAPWWVVVALIALGLFAAVHFLATKKGA